MKPFDDVRVTLFHWVGDYGLGFTMHYSPEGNLTKIVNPYDNTVLYPESFPVEREGSIREVDERGS